jgi:hypothetical protein
MGASSFLLPKVRQERATDLWGAALDPCGDAPTATAAGGTRDSFEEEIEVTREVAAETPIVYSESRPRFEKSSPCQVYIVA